MIRLPELRWRAAARWGRTEGFSLMEVIVALAIILVVMTFSLAFFIRSMQGAGLQQQRQSAVAVADQAMELTRSVPAPRLVDGRDKSRVDAQWLAPGGVDTSQSVKQWDSTATMASTPLVPFSSANLANNVNYQVSNFVDGCYLGPTSSVCGPTPGASTHLMYRVSVEISWQPKADQGCSGASGACHYVVSTLRDPSADPILNTNGA